jgi:hypothetical protein
MLQCMSPESGLGLPILCEFGSLSGVTGRTANVTATEAHGPKWKFRGVRCPKLRGELFGRRILANEKMVNRVGRHKCGVTLWQM